MLKIVTSTTSIESAMKLRDAIEEVAHLPHKTILVSKSPAKSSGDTVIMRYGCQYGRVENEPLWGNSEFTKLCIDKIAFSNEFGMTLNVPIFYDDHLPTSWPVLVRNTLVGSKSEGITLCHSREDMVKVWKRGSYWTYFIQHSSEIRVLAVFTEDAVPAFRIYKKVPRDSTESTNEFINGLNGEDNTKWILKDIVYYPKVRQILEDINERVLALGGRFVAFDMIYSPDDGDWYVLEGNSGPWLSIPSAKWLAELFIADYGSLT